MDVLLGEGSVFLKMEKNVEKFPFQETKIKKEKREKRKKRKRMKKEEKEEVEESAFFEDKTESFSKY
jgi:hypothetical protein